MTRKQGLCTLQQRYSLWKQGARRVEPLWKGRLARASTAPVVHPHTAASAGAYRMAGKTLKHQAKKPWRRWQLWKLPVSEF